MWKWTGVAVVAGIFALGAVVLMQKRSSDWGDTVDHLPSGSGAALEIAPSPPPPPAAQAPEAPPEVRPEAPPEMPSQPEIANSMTEAPAPLIGQAEPPSGETLPPAIAALPQAAAPAPAPAPAQAPLPAPPPAQAAPAPAAQRAPLPQQEPQPQPPLPSVAAVSPPAPAAAPPAPAPPKAQAVPGRVSVAYAWAPEAEEDAVSTSAFMIINYEGSAPDRLVSVSSPDARSVTVQQMRGDVRKALPFRAIEFEPGIPVVFEPTGYQLVLDGLKHPLAKGRKLTVFLILERTGTIQVPVTVGEPQHAAGAGGGSE